jgi:hypothetical protein
MNFITKWFKKAPEPVQRVVFIPANLEEAVVELHSAFNTNEKREFANFSALDPGLSLHLTGGMAMRNNWKMWEPDGPLSSWFRKEGVWHPDDMSAIIYRSFWCSLNNVKFDLSREKTYYTQYWKQRGVGFDGVHLPNYKPDPREVINVKRTR